jgi:hypothetical protein
VEDDGRRLGWQTDGSDGEDKRGQQCRTTGRLVLHGGFSRVDPKQRHSAPIHTRGAVPQEECVVPAEMPLPWA